MSSKQQTLTGETAPKSHLTLERSEKGTAGYGVDAERNEFWCTDCGYRVTLSGQSSKEYGHDADCPYSVRTEVRQ